MNINPNDKFVEENSENFHLAHNEIEYQKEISKREKLLDEFVNKGILSVFLSRKNGEIFREDGITSQEASENAKLAREAYKLIQQACFYDLSNPKQAKEWLENLAPYLNNSSLNLESYIHMGVTPISNPVETVLEKLKQENYHVMKETVNSEADAKHNRIVNAYQAINNPNFINQEKEYITRQLEIVEPYVSDEINIAAVESYISNNANESINEIISMITKVGANQTILNILSENGYDHTNETNISADENEVVLGLTEEQYEHNLVYNMYEEIKECGFLFNPLKEEIDKQERLMQIVINSQEIHDYLEKMEARTNQATFTENSLSEEDIYELTGKKKIALPAFIERFISKISPVKEEKQESFAEDQTIIDKLDELSNANYDTFAYGLRALKNYINDPEKPLNLSNGVNVIQKILEKAEELGYQSLKKTEDIIKENPNVNPALVNYCVQQLNDLEEYGCFLTSKCNDILKEKNINLEEVKENVSENTSIIEYQKQLPAVRIDMDDIFKKIVAPGVYQTEEETDTLVNLWNINEKSDSQEIEQVTNQINNLPESNTQKVILESWNKFITELDKPKTKLDTYQMDKIVDELVKRNNDLLAKNGIEKGMRIVEINDEIKSLTQELANIKPNAENSLNNGLTLLETISKSKNHSESFEEFSNNLVKEREENIQNLTVEKNNLLSAKNMIYEKTFNQFFDSYKAHVYKLEDLKEAKASKKDIKQAESCVQQYIDLREKFVAIENLKKQAGKDSNNKTKDASFSIIEESIANQEVFLKEIKELVDKMQTISSYSEEEKTNLLTFAELAKLGIEIEKKNHEINKQQLELSQIKEAMPKNNQADEEAIKQKIKLLEEEEKMLSFNPDLVKEEISQMILNHASKEELANKLDELILPLTESQPNSLEEEISALEIKLNDDSNYIDQARIAFDMDIKDNLAKQIILKEQEINELKKQSEEQEAHELLEAHKSTLLKQKASYEEEKQILLQWNIEETESNQEVRNALEDLFKESKENLESIQKEIDNCDSRLEKVDVVDKEKNNERINELLEEKRELGEKIESIDKLLSDKKNPKYINKEAKLSDIEELNRKKKLLSENQIESLSNLKEQFLEAYDKEIEISKKGALPLPGVLENGDRLMSDGSIESKAPESLPGVLANGDHLMSDGSIEQKVPELPGVLATGEEFDSNGNIIDDDSSELIGISEPNPRLLAKAKEKLKKIGKEVFNWIKSHPKVAAVVATVAVGGAIIIKSLAGGVESENKDATIPMASTIATSATNFAQEKTNSMAEAVDKAIELADQGLAAIDEANQQTHSVFQENYENAIDNVLEGKTTIYTSADRAINDQDGITVDGLYTPSFENADLGSIYKQEDGKVVKVSFEEAQNIVANGGQVGVLVENEGEGIGFVSVGGELANSDQNTSSISK